MQDGSGAALGNAVTRAVDSLSTALNTEKAEHAKTKTELERTKAKLAERETELRQVQAQLAAETDEHARTTTKLNQTNAKLAERETGAAKRKREEKQEQGAVDLTCYSTALLAGKTSAGGCVLVPWTGEMKSIAWVLKAPDPTNPSWLHVECSIKAAKNVPIVETFNPRLVVPVTPDNIRTLLEEVLAPENLRKLKNTPDQDPAESEAAFFKRALLQTTASVKGRSNARDIDGALVDSIVAVIERSWP
ncbi:hypothetical protein EMIHUDRAFT_207597 [Emiliania huxleyi CCMP1516]|uniref:MSP domain-containing protein n=2 Tax=Emiliania huxleyi TaxID=2903 RepID=A0A0D3JDQ1_EMIH1|nr:hypothetical protein EMIHUDRAFT_207597 [Emiliania huxleyi CCMP1516]EOD21636.1 hypothetical protein EMIHUDRAFT_207597 [Emiliania huxleyi CCMP1516]|eukprot:XP_005774065.1 hypothetical protein EMIHUDRAFT_207597 [Emiliania huxleyi CCMP1516]